MKLFTFSLPTLHFGMVVILGDFQNKELPFFLFLVVMCFELRAFCLEFFFLRLGLTSLSWTWSIDLPASAHDFLDYRQVPTGPSLWFLCKILPWIPPVQYGKILFCYTLWACEEFENGIPSWFWLKFLLDCCQDKIRESYSHQKTSLVFLQWPTQTFANSCCQALLYLTMWTCP
jgi:hypothetical protein